MHARTLVHSAMPASLAFEEAVTLPILWTTAHGCFLQMRLRSMQSVLVHAASGGTGLLCVEWARRLRVATYGTAGSVAKHSLLRSCNLERLSSSRDAASTATVLSRLLSGYRLHSLVNALSNDFVSVSIGLLSSRGVFVEIGKNRIWSQNRSFAVRSSLGRVVIAVDEGCLGCPGWNMNVWWFNTELCQLSKSVQTGEVQPLLLEACILEMHAVQAALRLLQRGANFGKVVVQMRWRKSMFEQSQQALAAEIETFHRRPERRADGDSLVHLSMNATTGVAVVELHDPARFNTMSAALGEDMSLVMNHLRQRRGSFSGLILQGAGSIFCAGVLDRDPSPRPQP